VASTAIAVAIPMPIISAVPPGAPMFSGSWPPNSTW
jgi:hypothetical protein